MLDEEQGVNTEESPTTEEETKEVVNTEQEPTPVTETQEEVVEETSTQEVKPEVKDDRPVQNVAWENKRKLDEIYPLLHEIKDNMLKGGQQEPQQQQYSKAQLRTYAQDPGITTEQRLWAWTEVDKLEKSERAKEYEKLVRTTSEKNETDIQKANSARWVATNFPDVTLKDTSGNFAGWNQNSPLLRKANEYMFGDKQLQDHPSGFTAAVKMAAFDLGISMKANAKIKKTVGQLRKEQKKGLASSGGTKSTENAETASKTRMAKLKQEYAKTGSKEVFAEMIKLRKMNPFI